MSAADASAADASAAIATAADEPSAGAGIGRKQRHGRSA